jgi:hypothetical protein
MPTPQENSLFVEQASCLFLRMLQDVSSKGFSFFSKHSSPYYKPSTIRVHPIARELSYLPHRVRLVYRCELVPQNPHLAP